MTRWTNGSAPRGRSERGVVLALVLVLALLLSVSLVTFGKRALIDTMIVRNRDDAAKAAALARGGLRLATAMLVFDRFTKNLLATGVDLPPGLTPGNTPDDVWNQLRDYDIVDPEGGRIRIEIRDAGNRLNLNAIVPYTGTEEPTDPDAEQYLTEILTRIIDEMPIEPAERALYDPRELARNLIDYMDVDPWRTVGGREDDYYLAQDPPYHAANRPLLSVDELGLVEGFDGRLVDALRPYVTVYPIVDAPGIDLNTAPPHVLGLVYSGVSGDRRLLTADTVGRILKVREEGRLVCTTASPEHECVSLSEVDLGEGSVFPPAVLPDDSDTFTVRVRARVGEIQRTLVAVVDRKEITAPQLLFWRMQ